MKDKPSGLNWILAPDSAARRLIVSPPLPMIIPTEARGTITYYEQIANYLTLHQLNQCYLTVGSIIMREIRKL